MLDKLVQTDGAQALVAAMTVVDESGGASSARGMSTAACPVRFRELLGNRWAQIILLAPSNSAFETFLRLDPGVLDGLTSAQIADALPGILDRLTLGPVDLCNLLLNHVSVSRSRVTPSNASADALLTFGSLPVEGGQDLPVAVGRAGVWINYEGAITERDVFTVNGVIHYLDSVIVDAPPPPPPTPDGVCGTLLCASDATLADKCDTLLDRCFTELGVRDEECVGGALLICEGGPPDDVGLGDVCSRRDCGIDQDLAQRCETFLAVCLAESLNERECFGGAFFICREIELFGD